MIAIPLFEAFVAIGARTSKPISPLDYFTHVTQSSKDAGAGSLFVALTGKQVDGHDFVREAQANGAVAAVVERRVEKIDIPQLVVASSTEALGNLGKIWKGRLSLPLVAVTGSVGKTSTKEMIAHVLSKKYATHRSRGNFNNQLGVPLELLRLTRDHQISVVEFAMRGPNEIGYLSRLARPTIGVITNIGISHIERLGSLKNIARAKAEIFQGIDSEGTVVLNADDGEYEYLKEFASCKTVSYGESNSSDYRISDVQLNSRGLPAFRINGVPISMTNCAGKHQALNAGAAYAVADLLGMRHEDIAEKISTFSPPDRRGQISEAACKAILLDNTYNASQDSIKASLHTLSDLRTKGKRAIAVIGEMLELGKYSEEAHRHVGQAVKARGIDVLVTVGEYGKFIGEAAELEHWQHFSTASLAANFMLREALEDDVILIQGSRGVSLEIVVASLQMGKLVALSDIAPPETSTLVVRRPFH